jgi:hypothetical protein
MARSVSVAVASDTSATSDPSAGQRISRVPPAAAASQVPSMYRVVGVLMVVLP